MKQMYALYIGIGKYLDIRSKELAGYLINLLSSLYQVHLIGICLMTNLRELRKSYDLIFIQNSISLIHYKKIDQTVCEMPWYYLLQLPKNIDSYVTPFENMFGVLNMGNIVLSTLGIPEEMEIRLCCPVERTGNYYFYEQQPEVCRIVYCPTGNSVGENDFKLLTFLGQTNASLTIVSDEYACLRNAFPPFVTVVSRSSWFSAYKQAHLVVASGSEAVQALALCKPCVVMGDYGLGGLVTSENYVQLQSVHFKGRKGGSFGESVSPVLLESVIRKVFAFDRQGRCFSSSETGIGNLWKACI